MRALTVQSALTATAPLAAPRTDTSDTSAGKTDAVDTAQTSTTSSSPATSRKSSRRLAYVQEVAIATPSLGGSKLTAPNAGFVLIDQALNELREETETSLRELQDEIPEALQHLEDELGDDLDPIDRQILMAVQQHHRDPMRYANWLKLSDLRLLVQTLMNGDHFELALPYTAVWVAREMKNGNAYPKAWMHLAKVYFELGKYAQAQKHVTQSHQYQLGTGERASKQIGLEARILLAKNKTQEAFELADAEARELDGRGKQDAFSFSLAYVEVALAAGKIEEARAYVQILIEYSYSRRALLWKKMAEKLAEANPQPSMIEDILNTEWS